MKNIMRNLEEANEVELIDDDEEGEEEALPIQGSSLYPRIFTGDSARELPNDVPGEQYPQSAYMGDDNNIHQTWLGLMSYYG